MGEILRKMKLLLGITDDEKDKLLTLYAEIAVQSILDYCNISTLPDELSSAAAQIAAEAYGEVFGEGKVSSVSEAGRSVSFDVSLAQASAQERVNARRVQFSRYRRLYRG